MRCSESGKQDTFNFQSNSAEDIAVQQAVLSCDILFLDKVVDKDARHVVGVRQNNRHFHASKREEQVDTSRVTFNGI